MKCCKHVRDRRPKFSTVAATATLTAQDHDQRIELCAMCAGFLAEALDAMAERGAVPMPIDRANTEGLV